MLIFGGLVVAIDFTRPAYPAVPLAITATLITEADVVGAMVLLQQGGAEHVGFVTDPLDSYPVPE